MNAKMRKVKRFVKEHKKELAIAAVTIAGGAIAFAITRKKSDEVTKAMECIWEIVDCNTDGSCIDAVVSGITVSDLGKVGADLVKLETANPDTEVTAIISLIKDVKVETF